MQSKSKQTQRKTKRQRQRESVLFDKYHWCKETITAWENFDFPYGRTPRRVVETIEWLLKWYPAYKDRLLVLVDRMTALYNLGIFLDTFEFWQI